MDTTNLKVRLDSAVKRRDDLAQKKQRLLGRLEEAERSLEELREKCRAKGIDPDNLDGVIERLETNLEDSVTRLESKITEAERALEPYTNNRK